MKISINIMKSVFVILFFLLSWFITLFLFYGPEFINISLIGEEKVKLNINSNYFETGFIANIGPVKLTKFVNVKSNVDNSKLGNYEVKYYVDYLIGRKEITREVEVIDGISPVINLKGETNIVLNKYYNYEEPGYEASDNLDGDLTESVKVVSNVDTSTLGTYSVKYSLSDKAGNKTVVERSVEIVDNNILSNPVSTFRLNGLFGNVMLEKSDIEYSFMDDAVIVGDSNIRFLYQKGQYLNADQVWGKNNLNAGDMSTAKVMIHETGEELTVIDAVKKYKPKYLIVSFGITSTSFLTKQVFIDKVSSFFELMKEECPDTKLVVVSILPVSIDYAVLQSPINKYNYYLLELCDKYKIGYINITDSLKDESGYGSQNYFYCASQEDCGYHLSEAGKEFYVDYLKHVDLSKVID
ncbi:MAG: DUF5011 domain-containing protein [Firmicutes bacterium]|nr:DUF5011 domain-containing protein [Bacillota bacterium]